MRENKTAIIIVRVSEEQKELLQKDAKSSNLDLSKHIRQKLGLDED